MGREKRRLGRSSERVANRGKLLETSPGHRPSQLLVVSVVRGEIFGDELTGESGRAIDDDVELRRRFHIEFPRLWPSLRGAKRRSNPSFAGRTGLLRRLRSSQGRRKEDHFLP